MWRGGSRGWAWSWASPIVRRSSARPTTGGGTWSGCSGIPAWCMSRSSGCRPRTGSGWSAPWRRRCPRSWWPRSSSAAPARRCWWRSWRTWRCARVRFRTCPTSCGPPSGNGRRAWTLPRGSCWRWWRWRAWRWTRSCWGPCGPRRQPMRWLGLGYWSGRVRAGRLSAALSVLESDAGVAGRAGNVGRAATLHLAALQLAGRHASLAPRRAGLEGAAIRELFLAGRWTELDPLVRRAWSRRDRLSLPERAWLANVLAVHLFWTGEVGEARALVERELAHLERHDALDQGAMLLAQAAFVAGFLGEDQQARQHTERALEIARRTGDAEAECRARYIQIYVLYALDRDRPAAIARARDTAAFAHAHGLTTSQATALYAEAARQAAERAGAWDYANLAQLLRGVFLLLQGQPDDAEAIFVRVSPEIRLSRPAAAAPWMDAAEAFLHLHRGDLEEARRLLHQPGAHQAAHLSGRVADRAAALGWLAWEEDRWEEAAEQLAGSMQSWVRGWQLMVGGPMWLPLHVDALLRLGRPADATAIVEAASSQREPPRFFAAALAVASFRLEPSLERAAEAQALSVAAPWPWLGALLGCWRGELLADRQAAQAARALFERVGADLGVQRAERVLRRLGASLPAGAGAAGPLSPRELEVAGLVAEGLSNPAIARRLYLSRPTIAHHVAHILTKLGFASRAQIAAWVVQQRGDGGA